MTIIIIICNSYQVLHEKEHLIIRVVNMKTVLNNILSKLQQISWQVCNVMNLYHYTIIYSLQYRRININNFML